MVNPTPSGLTLHPDIHILSPEDMERALVFRRSRRLLAAIAWAEDKNTKVKKKISVVDRRLAGEFAMFEKELASVDRSLSKLEARAHKISLLRQTHAQHTSDLVVLGADADADEDSSDE